jgi:hypothetical protein
LQTSQTVVVLVHANGCVNSRDRGGERRPRAPSQPTASREKKHL